MNGRSEQPPDDPYALLVDVLRGALNLTGTKLVCGAGRSSTEAAKEGLVAMESRLVAL